MDLRRRFIFRGNAAAIGGRIVRPQDLILENTVASSLTVVGGRSVSSGGRFAPSDYIGYDSAKTVAEGVFDDLKQQIELSYQRVPEDALTMTTTVSAAVNGLHVGTKPRFVAQTLVATLVSKSPRGSGEPSIAVDPGTTIAGVSIDGHPLNVQLATPTFQKYDTRSKLLAAADDPQFVKESGDSLLMRASLAGVSGPPAGRLLHACGHTYATLVRSISWARDPYPGATIDHHVLTVPNFGKIFFGELLIAEGARRLTLVRFELGSPDGGSAVAPEVDANGTWSN
jgi:hypothetical protein